MIQYVVGIVICDSRALFIVKNRPEWQAGRLNGVGGKIKEKESPYDAIVRKCNEECGLALVSWAFLGNITRKDEYVVHYFGSYASTFETAYSATDERITIVDLAKLDYNTLVPPTDLFLRYYLNPYYMPLFLEEL